MVDEIAIQIEVQKVNVKTKTVNQDVVKEIGPMSYPLGGLMDKEF